MRISERGGQSKVSNVGEALTYSSENKEHSHISFKNHSPHPQTKPTYRFHAGIVLFEIVL